MSTKTKPSPLSPTGVRLLSMALDVADQQHNTPETAPPLSEFMHTYREWIAVERGRPGNQQQQAERWQLIVHGMLSAGNVEEAIHLLIRYARVIWGERGPSELRMEEDTAVLVFSEPHRPGPDGLIAAIWHLALTICKLEFLANAKFSGVAGRVLHEPCLPDSVVRLLFGRPLEYEQAEVALLIPNHQLRRPIVARSADLPVFFQELLPLTLGTKRERLSFQSLVSGLIHDDKRGAEYRESTLENVAVKLGMSSATLRRRLNDEGTTFRKVRDAVYDTLAQAWLAQRELSVADIAERLGYSDTFAFRRFFHRRHNCSPSAFRQRFL